MIIIKNRSAVPDNTREAVRRGGIFKKAANAIGTHIAELKRGIVNYIKHKRTPKKGIEPEKKLSGRIKCIDAFRGIAVAAMLAIENPGNPYHVSPKISHAPWDGMHFADYFFPFFIFMSGVSIPISIRRRLEHGDSKLKIFIHILYRSIALFITGLFLNGFPLFDFHAIRIPGVLQRIAVVYLIAGILTLWTNTIVEAFMAAALLALYCWLMKKVNVPGYGAGILAIDGNLVQYVDLKYLKGHLYTPTFDPEGILSTIPAVSTILSGVLCGKLLISQKLGRFDWVKKVIILVAAGIICIYAGNYISRWFPINKKLWSSSFVLYTSGVALAANGLLYLIMDVIGYSSIFKPFTILGGSPLLVYVGFELVSRTLWKITLPGPGGAAVPLNQWLCIHIIKPWSGDAYDSYYFSIVYAMLWVLIVWTFKGRKENVGRKSLTA